MINLEAGIKNYVVTFNPAPDLDVVGYVINASLESGFTPSASNVVSIGPDTSVTIPSDDGVYYVKVAAYDSFEDPENIDFLSLNYSEEKSVEVRSVGDVIAMLSGQITDSELHSELSSRIDLIDLPELGLVDRLAQEVLDRAAAVSGEAQARAAALDYYYTKVEADTAIAQAVVGATSGSVTNESLATALTSYYTKTEADSATATAITGATSSFISGSSLATALSSYYTKVEADSATATAITGATSSLVSSSSLATALSSYYTKAEADSATATAITGATSSLVSNTSLATSLSSYYTKVATDSAIATASSGAVATANNNTASALINYSTTVQTNTAINGAITTAVSAKMMLKVDANGKIAGIGLWSDGVTSNVEILADRFSIVGAGPGATPLVPFIVDQGTVYIAKAAIKDGDIDNAKIGNVIQSSNYVAGSAGWKIDKAGSPEFNSGTFRGKVIFGAASSGYNNLTDKPTSLAAISSTDASTLSTASSTAATALTNAATAQNSANTANSLLSDIAADNKLTATEKHSVRKEWDIVAAEWSGISTQADTFTITTEKTNYINSFQALANYLNAGVTWSSGVPSWISDANLSVTTTIVGSTFRTNWKNYYDKRTALLNAIATKAKTIADAAHTAADTAVTTANTAAANATTAAANATTANNLLTDIASDSRLTPNEKYSVRKEWDIVAAEKAGIGTQATSFGITTEKTTYDSAFQSLANYLNSGVTWSSGIPAWLSDANLSTTTAIVGAAFRVNWKNYYDARTALLNAIAAKAATMANFTDGDVTTIARPVGGSYTFSGGVTGAIKIALPVLWTNTMIQFSVDVYNYSANKHFTVLIGGYNSSSVGWVNTSSSIVGGVNANYAVRYGHDGVSSCVWIGEADTVWSHPKVSVKNVIVGYINYSIDTWKSGWDVSMVTAFNTVTYTDSDNMVYASDVAKVGGTLAATVRDNAATALADATTANSLLSDIASDSKLTPVEKQSVKLEWDVVVAEKSANDTQATSFGITTEKTAYGTAYTTLSTYITPLLTDLTATSNIVGATFRTNFKNYYDARTTLLNAIATKAKTLADAAQSTANTASNTITNWTKPGETTIDGNKIYTGDAYVDTLQIKGEALILSYLTLGQNYFYTSADFSAHASIQMCTTVVDLTTVPTEVGNVSVAIRAHAYFNGYAAGMGIRVNGISVGSTQGYSTTYYMDYQGFGVNAKTALAVGQSHTIALYADASSGRWINKPTLEIMAIKR